MGLEISRLTNAEKLIIERRRRDESQRRAAKRHRVSLYLYKRWEAGLDDPPGAEIGRVRPHEKCFIARRRAGIPMKELAARIGLTPWWASQMEKNRAPAGRLIEYWDGVAQGTAK